jgi:hypothetical protein
MSVTSSGGSGDWREEGEAAMLADGPYLSLIWGSTRPSSGLVATAGRVAALCYAPPTTNQPRWVAKPVQLRHSPATVIARFDEKRA